MTMRAAKGVATVCTLCMPLLANADAPPGRVPPSHPPRSIHQLDSEQYGPRAGGAGYTDPLAGKVPRRLHAQALTHEVHGYHPYWMGSSYQSYDWSLLSTVAFFSLELGATGAIVADHGWPWTTLVSHAHQNGVRVIVTATQFSSTDLAQLLGSASIRATAIANIVNAVVAGNADGVSIDFEGVPGSRKQQLVAFMNELRAALDATLPDPYLSIATPAVDWNNAYDYDLLAAACDHLMVMAYDFHWSGSTTSGPVAPLGGWGTYNVGWTIADYITWGAPPEKMLLGVPYYGYRWGTVSGAAGATTTGTGTARTYAAVAAEVEQYDAQWDTPSLTPWYRGLAPGWFQTWHDDAASLGNKYSRVHAEDLAGVGIWALGYDGTRAELWGALHAAFHQPTDVDPPGSGLQIALSIAGRNPSPSGAEFQIETRGRQAALRVYDARGRRVRVLWTGRSLTPVQVSWDGADDAGRRVSAGIYYASLQSDAGSQTRKVVLTR